MYRKNELQPLLKTGVAMRGLHKRLMRTVGGGWWLGMTAALSALVWAASASAQTTNSPLFEPSPGAAAGPAPSWPAWQGMEDGRGIGDATGAGGRFGTPYSSPGTVPSVTPNPQATQPVFPSRNYPSDRTPALRDLTQRPVSPLENGARDAGVRQQVYPAPASSPGYGR
jgi:hypothetical protein